MIGFTRAEISWVLLGEIAVLAQGGEVQSVAYYSKWKPRTCSVHLQRGDAYSRWKDTGDATSSATCFFVGA